MYPRLRREHPFYRRMRVCQGRSRRCGQSDAQPPVERTCERLMRAPCRNCDNRSPAGKRTVLLQENYPRLATIKGRPRPMRVIMSENKSDKPSRGRHAAGAPHSGDSAPHQQVPPVQPTAAMPPVAQPPRATGQQPPMRYASDQVFQPLGSMRPVDMGQGPASASTSPSRSSASRSARSSRCC